MSYEKLIRFCYIIGAMKKTRCKESRYDIMEWYKFRLWNPLTWVIYTIAVIIHIPRLIAELISENNEEYEVHREK